MSNSAGADEARPDQHVVIVSGLSGAGKSTALKALEDMGYHCIDNLPVPLLSTLAAHIRTEPERYRKVALGIDARALGERLAQIPAYLEQLRADGLKCQVLYLDAEDNTLIKRFGETRRRHPLTTDTGALQASIHRERGMLKPISDCADWKIDTSHLNIHQLTHQTWRCVGPDSAGMTLVLQSFGFSRGVPSDVDFLFDLRSLPNPHWDQALRPLTGRDHEVAAWLGQQEVVGRMSGDILAFLSRWLPDLQQAHRHFVTVGFGCTGGRHRSVYVTEQLAASLREAFPELMVHHRDLGA